MHADLSIWARRVQADKVDLLTAVQDPQAEANSELHGQGVQGQCLSVPAHRVHNAGAEVLDVRIRCVEGVDELAIRHAVGGSLVRVLDEEVPDKATAGPNEGLVHGRVLGDPALQLCCAAPGAQLPQQALVAALLRGGLVPQALEGADDPAEARPASLGQERLDGAVGHRAVVAVAVAADGAPVAVAPGQEPHLADLPGVEAALVLERLDTPELADIWKVSAAGGFVQGEHLLRGFRDAAVNGLVEVRPIADDGRAEVAADVLPRRAIRAQELVSLRLWGRHIIVHGRQGLHNWLLMPAALTDGHALLAPGTDAMLTLSTTGMSTASKPVAHCSLLSVPMPA
mmetsp:Transcript_43406/g.138106  ORF Transcript_43406/g.138106 Transcript_43406/m.138106 type:complete len:342 (-) Transcript_43406:2-1027(-)